MKPLSLGILMIVIITKQGTAGFVCLNEGDFTLRFGEGAFKEVSQEPDKESELADDSYFRYVKLVNFAEAKDGKAVVKMADHKFGEGDTTKAAFEAELLTVLKNVEATPVLYGCLNHDNKIFLVMEKLCKGIYTKEMVKKFHDLSAYKKIFKFLQIATAIQALHEKGFTHQKISTLSILSSDSEMSDLRLSDLSSAKRVGEESSTLDPSSYDTMDKHRPTFKAELYHDIHAFALTTLGMENPDFAYFEGVDRKCFSVEYYDNFREEYNKNCIGEYKRRINELSQKSQLSEYFSFLESELYNEANRLTMSKIIKKLVEVYAKLANEEMKSLQSSMGKVKEIESRFTNQVLL